VIDGVGADLAFAIQFGFAQPEHVVMNIGFSPRKRDSPATAGLFGFRKVCMGPSGFQIFAASPINHRTHNHTIENLEVPPRR
jgi:hypothetical protein